MNKNYLDRNVQGRLLLVVSQIWVGAQNKQLLTDRHHLLRCQC